MTTALGRLPGPRATAPTVTRSHPGSVQYAGVSFGADFADINVLRDLGRPPNLHRHQLYPAIMTGPQAALFNADAVSEELRGEHVASGSVGPVYVYGITGHELGGCGLLHADGRVLVLNDVIPNYFNNSLGETTHSLPDYWTGSLLLSDAEVIEVDQPLAIALHPNMVYGHFLLEMLPRLHLLARIREFGAKFALAVPREIPDWLRSIISIYYDDAEVFPYNAASQRIKAPCFIMPSMMNRDYHLHDEFNHVADTLVNFVLGYREPEVRARRLYLSRSKLNDSWHGIENELEVEAVMQDFGFDIIHPQSLSFPEQVALYASASCVASEYGSATHNSLFAPRGAKVVCINRRNWYQGRIGTLRAQPHAFMPPASGRWWDWRIAREEQETFFRVDCRALRTVLADFLTAPSR